MYYGFSVHRMSIHQGILPNDGKMYVSKLL